MRFKKVGFLLLVLPFCLAADIPDNAKPLLYSENVLYHLTGEENLDIHLSLKPSVQGTYKLVSRLYNNKTNAMLFSNINSSELTNNTASFTITYPLLYHLNGDGLRFYYELTYSEGSLSYSGVVYPYSFIQINALQNRENVYTTQNRFIKVEPEQIATGESFSFENFNEYVSKNENNEIEFSSIYFNYLHNYEFVYDDVELHINDYYNVFPFLKKTKNDIVLKMKCINKNGEISFALNERLYVNNRTLDMSSFKITNFVSTDKLYIPIGKQDLLEQTSAHITLKGAGYSSINIVFPLSFYFSKKMIGLCYNSDYCIEGGVLE